MQRVPRIPFFLFAFAISLLSAAEPAAGQSSIRNNPYSPSPVSKARGNEPVVAERATVQVAMNTTRPVDPPPVPVSKPPEAQIRKTPPHTAKPSEIYRIGTGDVLFIDLKNAANASGYYTVADDGTINYPLAGEHVVVSGQTSDEIAAMLASSIKLYDNAAVDVKVKDRASHKITVTGLVEQNGDHTIPRDAVPLFVIKAEVGVESAASSVKVRHSNGSIDTFALSDQRTDEFLIVPGDAIEFVGKGSPATTVGFFYAAGEVAMIGQHELVAGMTLLQAITASGGAKGNPKKVFVRRKNDKGVLNVMEFNLRSIKDGKSTDPALVPGDMIEIGN